MSDQPFVQKWKSLGMRESDFVEEYMSPFRYTIYAAKADANLPGRPNLLQGNIPEDAIFVDRSHGNLAKAFRELQQRSGDSDSFEAPYLLQVNLNKGFSLFPVNKDKTMSVYLSADVMKGLSLLSESPSLQELASPFLNDEDDGERNKEALLFQLYHNLNALIDKEILTLWKKP